MTNDRRDPLLGVHLEGRYQITDLIARGGMSSVYRGLDTRLDRPVAVKVMDPRYSSDQQFLSRFSSEARAVARLNDSGIAQVYDQGRDGDYVFLVMELVNGGTLRELLRERGPMPPHAATAVMTPVLGGLGTAHRAGLVHRDVKPENILISDSNEVKVVDFGLVRAIDAAGITSHSVILGTAAYLSPEQVDSAHTDARSDIYSSGILLFELLTGQTPFRGDNALGLAYQRLKHDVPAPSSIIEGIPPEFDDLVLTATARNPADRYADGFVMREALIHVARDLQLPPCTVPVPTIAALKNENATAAPAQPLVPEHIAAQQVRQMTKVHTFDPELANSARSPHSHPEIIEAPEIPAPYLPASGAESLRKSRKRITLWILFILLMALLLGLGGWWLGAGQFTKVPQNSSLDRAAVEKLISDAGLEIKGKPTYDNELPVDQVISISPQPGTRVKRWSTITIAYSVGQPKVPNIKAGTGLAEAERKLAEATLIPQPAGQQHSSFPKGTVISLSPSAGSMVKVGTTVAITLSSGPEPIKVPDIVNRTQSEATKLLTSAGFSVGATTTEFSPNIDGGKTIRSSPSVGTIADRGSTITLVLSDAISIPDLNRLTPDEARKKLQDAKLIATDGGTTLDGDAPSGQITKSDPPAGSRIDPRNPTVIIYTSNGSTVPNVTGDTVETARKKLKEAGLNVKISGLGLDISIVVNQSSNAGSRVQAGSTITITSLP